MSDLGSSKDWATYERFGSIEARSYADGDQADLYISFSLADLNRTSLDGGMIARNPANPKDQWYIAADYFAKHYRAANEPAAPPSKELAELIGSLETADPSDTPALCRDLMREAAFELEKLTTPEPAAEPIGFVARRKSDGYVCSQFARPGFRTEIADGFEWVPVFDRSTPPPAVGRGEPSGCICKYVDGSDPPARHDDGCPALTKPDDAVSSVDHHQKTGSPECWCGHRKASHDHAGCCGICSCVKYSASGE